MKPKFAQTLDRNKPTRGRHRSRFGYDHRWWRESARIDIGEDSGYWASTRRPFPCLVFVAPLLVLYELGLYWAQGGVARAGADAWAREGLRLVGLTDHLFPPLLLAIGLLAWQVCDNHDWRFSPWNLAGMLLESLVLALGLIGLSRLVDVGLTHVEGGTLLETSTSASASTNSALLSYLGAGIYEEALFRLALIPFVFWALRLIQTPGVLAGTLAVTTSAILFALAHHIGIPGEAFTWFAFIFRWSAGVYFAWIFLARGFAVAVGTHAAYDVMVGHFGWHW